MNIEPVGVNALPDIVKDVLRKDIINGKFKPGERLIETELASAMQISRGTLRQAIRDLELEGLVKVLPRRGTVVTRMSREDAADICEVRALLEGHAVEQAIQNGHVINFYLLEQFVAEMEEAASKGDLYEIVQADVKFHEQICQGGKKNNQRLFDLWSMLNAQMSALIVSTLEFREVELSTIADHHYQIIEALKSGDSFKAKQCVMDHYITSWRKGEKND